jgi:hypothetical protein
MIPAVAGMSAPNEYGYLWVAVGASGAMYTSTSTTASSWTSRTSGFGNNRINGVAANGSSLFVAVGSNGVLTTSPDGTNWTARTSSFGTTEIFDVAYGNGYWVAVGASGKVAYSTDGATWTQKTTGITGTVCAVAYGNGLWVIGNTTGGMYTATDPSGTWTSRTSTLTQIGDRSIHYFKGGNIWIAGAEGNTGTTVGTMASSSDGTTWDSRNSATNIYLSTLALTSNSTTAVMALFKSVVGPAYDIASTTNGTTWTDRTPATASTVAIVGGAASDASNLMALGAASIQTSTDGATWTDRGAIAAGFTMNALCHSSGTPSIR